MCFLHRNPQIHLEKVSKFRTNVPSTSSKKTIFYGYFLGSGNQYHQGPGRVWRKAPSLEALKGRSGTSGEDNEGLIGKRGLANSRLWGRLIANTHLVLAVQLSIILSFNIFDILILKKQTWKIKSSHSHDSMALYNYISSYGHVSIKRKPNWPNFIENLCCKWHGFQYKPRTLLNILDIRHPSHPNGDFLT